MSDDPGTSTASASTPSSATSGSLGLKVVEKNREQQKDRFRYGNFNRYYGVRKAGFDSDPRLELLPRQWFQDRQVLDIGCNAGHLTLEIAKKLQPQWILGIDIDEHLVGVARKNIRHYFPGEQCIGGKFPAPVQKLNVWFARENYVLESDDFLEMVREEYDTILALSITKWIHLNWGDAGMKRFFRRCFLHLNPGGRLILEAQDFAKYYKRAKMTPDMFELYKSIQFKPEQFKEYLLSEEVGFSECQELGVPAAKSKGFERPILVFTKGLTQIKRKRNKDSGKEVEVIVGAKKPRGEEPNGNAKELQMLD